MDLPPYEIIIVENNGVRPTYLDTLGCNVHYTMNNYLPTYNIGIKELNDIFSCIEAYKIQESDFIVKMTGRYSIHEDSEFLKEVKALPDTQYDCILKYGSYASPVEYPMKDCITGLIGMKCAYIKKIEMPRIYECVEWNWAAITFTMDKEKVHRVNKLGIDICPGTNTYFSV